MAADAAAALFDMDGALVNTPYPHALTQWKALWQFGHQVLDPGVPARTGAGVR
ncbi:hypothetical protein [Kitasatospora griseola]|uniref:hypothetical protein n=1 Tax=Kitasatospora griseola TaxID=2064 RepID=UPI00166F6BF3|nr:hypothetical protein [Kitasatospora griseola]GGQ67920.1 hypothetical protein GCM10010195_24470 [Kitasatospora griseola]